MERFKELISRFREIFEIKLFPLGEKPITLAIIIELILVLLGFLLISKLVRRILKKRILPRFKMADGAQFVIQRIIHYILMVIGFLFAINLVGIQLNSLTVIFGLVGVGIAFGLQNITSNFVSGIILLFERPVSVGDYIDVGDTSGVVESIDMRSTTIITLDNITLIVPNSKFIEDTVTNWSVGDPKVRIKIPVGVAYGSDTELVTKLLLEVAEKHTEVLDNPKPDVLFSEFGDSSLNFILRTWIISPRRKLPITSDLNYAIDKAFRDHDVTIPFPQRDVHFFRE
ncbi:mechanosensitive ion channel [Candidatus Poribacteria bacterium]|nr:mechanosensitive ion channel [Candidatus Poribacteria bacterium]